MSKKTSILIIDDEPKILRFVNTTLSLAGYEIISAEDGRTALDSFVKYSPDLVILDLGLPDIDGFDVLREIRSFSTTPIIILTARDDEKDKVQGLEFGADDYLTKPFGTAELEARIQAVLRRVEWFPNPTDVIYFKLDDLEIDFQKRSVLINNKAARLTPTEYDLLRVLVTHAGQVMLHSDLLVRVWGQEYRNDLAILRVNISRLRQKLEVDPRQPKYIITIPGVGYSIPAPAPE